MGDLTWCQCDDPTIRCDHRGCRCTFCGLPERKVSAGLQRAIDATKEAISKSGIGMAVKAQIASPPSPTLPSREAIEAEILPMTYEGVDLTECVDRILALFTAPQPLAKPMPLDTVEGGRKA